MADDLTRAIAEALGEALPGYSIRGRGATSAEVAAALAPLIEARVREARANEIEHILTHILTGPRSPATNALERRLAGLRDVD